MNSILETTVRTPQASPGKKPMPNLRLIGAEDAARLAMGNADDTDQGPDRTPGSWWTLAMQICARRWPEAAVISISASLAWLIG